MEHGMHYEGGTDQCASEERDKEDKLCSWLLSRQQQARGRVRLHAGREVLDGCRRGAGSADSGHRS